MGNYFILDVNKALAISFISWSLHSFPVALSGQQSRAESLCCSSLPNAQKPECSHRSCESQVFINCTATHHIETEAFTKLQSEECCYQCKLQATQDSGARRLKNGRILYPPGYIRCSVLIVLLCFSLQLNPKEANSGSRDEGRDQQKIY